MREGIGICMTHDYVMNLHSESNHCMFSKPQKLPPRGYALKKFPVRY